MEYEIIEVICTGCGHKFHCPEPEASGKDEVYCDECLDEGRVRPWRPDPTYRAGYDYACGYWE